MSVGRPFWEQAGVAHKIDVRIAPALDTLTELNANQANLGTFDFAYIDADKENYPNYVEQVLPLLKQNGYIIIDNVLWSGRVADEASRASESSTAALHQTVANLVADPRVDICTLMLADGVTVARKR